MSIAIITGASSGMGAEFARQLKIQWGVNDFWFVSRREEKMKALAEELSVNARIICADLTESGGIEKLRAELESEKPSVKYLINSAGFGNFGSFDQLPESEISDMIDLNVKALVLITHMVIPYMERGGRIVELGSGSCFTPLPYFNIYASSKAFVLHYTKGLNAEIKKYGLRATCFCPGWVETEFLGKATDRKAATMPRKMSPMLKCEDVVSRCVKRLDRGPTMYVTNWYTKLQHVLFKLVPDPILTKLWLGMLDHPKEEEK